MFCKACGTKQNPGAQFCPNCGTPHRAVTAPLSGVAQASGVATVAARAAAAPPPAVPKAPSVAAPAPPNAAGANRPLIIAGAVALVLLLAYFAYRPVGRLIGSGSNSTAASVAVDQKLEDAIARRNLISPADANAQIYYNQLRADGADAEKLARFRQKLMPLLTERPQQMLAQMTQPGSRDFTSADWQEAADMLAWASELNPGDASLSARAHYCRGRVAYIEKRADEALELWRRAGDTDRSWALPVNGVGLIYNERKEYDTARGYLNEAVRREPGWAYPYNNLGTGYFYQRDYDQAEYYYRMAVERAPQWARPHAWLGDIAYNRKEYARAAEEYQTVLDLSAGGAGGVLDLGAVQQKLNRARQLADQTTTYP